MFDTKGTEQSDRHDPQLLTATIEHVSGIFQGLGCGAHHDHHPLGIGRTVVVKQMVLAPGQPGQLIHGLLNDLRYLLVERIGRLPPLEVDIRVLGGTTDKGVIRVQGPSTVGIDQIIIDHGADLLIGDE